MAFKIDRGAFGGVALDDLGFVLGRTPEAKSTEPLRLTNTGHPANDALVLCHASNSHVNGLGFVWDDTSGKNNGHYVAFAWESA